MALKPEEMAWVDAASGVTAGKPGVPPLLDEVDAAEADGAIRARLLREAREALDRDVGVIQLGEHFKVELLSDFLKWASTVDSIDDDPNKAYDSGHDANKLANSLPKEQFQQLMVAQAAIVKQSQVLQTAFSARTKKKLFTDQEIAEAVWEPLKRRKLIAENAIPDRYSEVTRTFDGATKEYETRLVAYTQALPDHQKLIEGLGIAKDFFEAGGAVATAVIGDLTALKSPLINDPGKVASILKGVQVGTTSTLAVTQGLVKAHDQGKLTDPDTLLAVCKDVVKGTQGIIGAGFANSGDAGVALGKAISSGVGMAVNAVSIGVKIKKKDYLSIADDIADMVSASFAVYSANLKVQGGKDTGPSGTAGPNFKELGVIVADAIKANGKLLAALKDPSPEAFLTALLSIVQNGADAGSTWMLAHVNNPKLEEGAKSTDTKTVKDRHPGATKDELDTELKAYQKTTESDTSYAGKVIEGEWGALRDGIGGKFADADKKIAKLLKSSPEEIAKAIKEDPQLKDLAKRVEAQNKIVQEEGVALFKEEVAQDASDFRALLNRAETGETEEDVEKIEALIMQLKRDQMLLELAFQISGMTAQVVAAFLPQAGIAVSSIELIKNFTKAAQHFIAYAEWKDNVADARSAMSVQVEAMTNRMDLSMGQAAEACVKALEEAAKLVGSAVSVAGPFAPAGHVVAATMGGVSAVRALVVKYYRENQLRLAWNQFLSARTNPEDRKAMRKALRTNPTLAKYAIAWGAEFDQNPVAKNAMRKCGLSNDVLESKDANVQKVVAYLEALYPEDPVLLRPLDKPANWYPGPVEFSALSITSFAGAAQRSAKPKMQAGAAKKLIVQCTRWEQASKAYADAQKAWSTANDGDDDQATVRAVLKMQDACEAVRREIGALKADLQGFKPLDVKGEPHAGMIEYVALLRPIAIRLERKYAREAGIIAQQAGARADEAAVSLAA